MPKLVNPIEYLTFTKQQGVNFLEEIEEIVKNLLDLSLNDKQKAKEEYESLQKKHKKEKYRAYTEIINNSNFTNTKYLSGLDYLYGISITKKCYGIPLSLIQNFLKAYFKNHEFRNFKKGAKDLGTIEELLTSEIQERNNVENINQKESPPIGNETDLSQKVQDEYKIQLEKHDWALYSYGEKVVQHQASEESTRIFYVKERPVQFKNLQITLKNTDSAKIIFRNDVENRNGIVLTESNLTYKGNYQFFKRKIEGSDSILYLETESLKDDSNRHFRLILALGKDIKEIGLGTFSLIKDFGQLLSGAALLVKREDNYFENNKCKFYTSFKDESNTIPRAIRILLERRSRAYVKLPRVLDHYTLKNLESYLLKQKHRERKNYESREAIIHRKDAFISVPLNCNGIEASNKYNAILKKAVQLLKEQPYNLKEITYGTIKHEEHENNLITSPKKRKKEKHVPLESPGSREEYESNFDKIIQSNLVIFIFPPILFPYEKEVENEVENGKKIQNEKEVKNEKKIQNGNFNNISTAFMETGFAIGLRKKILILTSEKVFKTFPSIIKKFAVDEHNYVKIIKCELDNESKLVSSVKENEATILEFLDAHLDYEIIEE